MLVIVFMLGRPGSGKSTGAHHLTEVAWEHGLSAIRIGDYRILQRWFKQDRQHKRFTSAAHGGFDVTDFSVLDEALQALKREIEQRIRRITTGHEDQVIIIEFARNNYCEALRFFGPKILAQAHFVYVEADVSTCIEHIQKRALLHETPDDHFVSENIMKTYYAEDDEAMIPASLWGNFRISSDRIHLVKNTGSPLQFTRAIEPIIVDIIKKMTQEKRLGAGSFYTVARQRIGRAMSFRQSAEELEPSAP
jgi:hypothetical protein